MESNVTDAEIGIFIRLEAMKEMFAPNNNPTKPSIPPTGPVELINEHITLEPIKLSIAVSESQKSAIKHEKFPQYLAILFLVSS